MRVAACLLALVLLSGCFVEKVPDASTDSTGDSVSDGGSASGSKAASTSRAPGAAAPITAVGSIPVLANLSVNATGLDVVFTLTGDDADNQTVTWMLDFGDNSTANGTMARAAEVDEGVRPTGNHSLVATATHTYAAAGLYNVTAILSDGTGSANRTVTVSVADAAPSGPPMDPVTMSGSCTMPNSGFHEVEVLPGQAFIHGVISPGLTALDLDWTIFDPSGSEKDAGGQFDPIDGGEGELDVQGPVAGLWTVEVNCFAGAAASYDFTLTFH